MKTTTLERNGVSTQTVDLIGRLVELIPWPARRCAMGDVTVVLLDGKQRVAENVFGWNRRAIEVGIHEHQTGITCINDISRRVKPKTEDKHPKLLAEIQACVSLLSPWCSICLGLASAPASITSSTSACFQERIRTALRPTWKALTLLREKGILASATSAHSIALFLSDMGSCKIPERSLRRT